MTEPTTEIQVNAARSRWRADLLRYHSSELERIADDSPVGQSLRADATTKVAEATIHLDLAEAEEKLSVAKQERDVNPGDVGFQARYVQAAEALTSLRAYWRGIDEHLGLRRPARCIDNFPEPSDEDVLASHGGKV